MMKRVALCDRWTYDHNTTLHTATDTIKYFKSFRFCGCLRCAHCTSMVGRVHDSVILSRFTFLFSHFFAMVVICVLPHTVATAICCRCGGWATMPSSSLCSNGAYRCNLVFSLYYLICNTGRRCSNDEIRQRQPPTQQQVELWTRRTRRAAPILGKNWRHEERDINETYIFMRRSEFSWE